MTSRQCRAEGASRLLRQKGAGPNQPIGNFGKSRESKRTVALSKVYLSIMVLLVLGQSHSVEGMSWTVRQAHSRVGPTIRPESLVQSDESSNLSRTNIASETASASHRASCIVQEVNTGQEHEGTEEEEDDDSRVEFAFLRPDAPRETATRLRETTFSYTRGPPSSSMTEMEHIESLASPCRQLKPSRNNQRPHETQSKGPTFLHI